MKLRKSVTRLNLKIEFTPVFHADKVLGGTCQVAGSKKATEVTFYKVILILMI